MTTQRIALLARKLTNPIYLSASMYWGFRKLTRMQFHHVLAADLRSAMSTSLASPLQTRALETIDDLVQLPVGLETQLDEQSGLSCRTLLEQQARIYLITDGDRLACQLNIRDGEVIVDSPIDLSLRFDAGTVFLNYLYTRDAYRGRGLAGELMRFACEDLAKKGLWRCFAHIRATNHASLASFRKAGWTRCGRIITTTAGHFIAAPGCEHSGMRVTPISRA